MVNDPSMMDEQASAKEDRRPSDAAATATVRPNPLFGPLLWITPPLALIAVLMISAI
jgi:hypothetical protein